MALLLTVPQVVWSVGEMTCTDALVPAATVPSEHDNASAAIEHPDAGLATVQSNPELAGSDVADGYASGVRRHRNSSR